MGMGRKSVLSEKDIVEMFVRSAGPGGQKVNKASSCVYLKHLPTGIEVKCQQERSQHANRIRARQILLEKLQRRRAQQEQLRKKRLQQVRLAKRKRPAHLKERILEEKRKQSQKKKLRTKVVEVW